MFTGLCLPDPHPDYVNAGCGQRTLSATRFAGRYRVVDFMLSNMVNSGIDEIGMILNSHYQSLIDHIGTGKEWDLARKSGGITYFPPYLTDERQSVNSEIDGPLSRAAKALSKTKNEYIVLANSSIVYSMDFRPAIEAHMETGANVTAIYTKKVVEPDAVKYSVVFNISNENKITGIRTPKESESSKVLNVSLGAYIMHKTVFLELVSNEKNCGILRFAKDLLAGAMRRLQVVGYEFKGYSAQICSVDTFFKHNMEMLDPKKRNALFQFEGRRIYTSRRDTLPTKYGASAEIKNSIVADGCRIDGTIINSVICRNVRVKPGAVIKNCILQGGVIEDNAELEWIIVDRGAIVSQDVRLIGDSSYPVYIERDRVISGRGNRQ